MKFILDDGGRAAAGFKGETRDCVARAVAIAAQLPYREVYDGINALAQQMERRRADGSAYRSSARTGVRKAVSRRYIQSLGWTFVPTMGFGTGCRVHLRSEELPPGRLIVKLSGHVAAVIDGVLHDTEECSRGGTRCVYGYWRRDEAHVA